METNRVQVLDRALDIIEQLASVETGLGIAELAQRTGLPKSTVHRILSTFTDRQYIEKNRDTSVYSLGQKFVEIASIYLNNINLKTEAEPLMHELATAFGATCYLAVFDNNEVMYLERVEPFNNLRIYTQIGKREPLHCTALGKVLLSGLKPEVCLDTVSQLTLRQYTPNTITSRETLLQAVDEVRDWGYALDRNEHDIAVSCLAVPIYDYTGNIMAAMSISGPGLLENHKHEDILTRMLNASSKLSLRMGYNKML